MFLSFPSFALVLTPRTGFSRIKISGHPNDNSRSQCFHTSPAADILSNARIFSRPVIAASSTVNGIITLVEDRRGDLWMLKVFKNLEPQGHLRSEICIVEYSPDHFSPTKRGLWVRD